MGERFAFVVLGIEVLWRYEIRRSNQVAQLSGPISLLHEGLETVFGVDFPVVELAGGEVVEGLLEGETLELLERSEFVTHY